MPPQQVLEIKSMKTCKECKWHIKRSYNLPDEFTCRLHEVIYTEKIGTCYCFERKNMTDEEAYAHLQKSWVREYNVEVGDIVRVLRTPKTSELGSGAFHAEAKKELVGNNYQVQCIWSYGVRLDGWAFPFFCLDFVKKAEPEIKLTCEVNGKTVPLSTLSEETLLNLRKQL